jgi:hypothetical protein
MLIEIGKGKICILKYWIYYNKFYKLALDSLSATKLFGLTQ